MEWEPDLDLKINPNTVLLPEIHLNSPIVLNRTNLILWNLEESDLIQHQSDQYLRYHQARYGGPSCGRGIGRNSPLRMSAQEIRFRHKGLKEGLSPAPSYAIMDQLFSLWDTKIGLTIREDEDSLLQELSSLSSPIECLMDNMLSRTASDRGSEPINRMISKWTAGSWRPALNLWYEVRKSMRQLQFKLGSGTRVTPARDIIVLSGGNVSCLITAMVVLVYHRSRGWYTGLSPETVLMITDTVESRATLSHFLICSPLLVKVHGVVDRIITNLDRAFPIFGSRMYDIAAAIEALVQAEILSREWENPGQYTLYFSTFSDLQTVCRSDVEREFVEDFISTWCEAVEILSISEVSELMCLFRLWGHPFLDAQAACSKVRDFMESEIPIDMQVNKEIHAVWMSLVINGFQKKNNNLWPPMMIPEHLAPDIESMRRSGRAILPDQAIEYCDQLDLCRFSAFIPINLDENLSMFLKDRAIAPPLKEWDSIYSREVMPYDPPRPSKTRRLAEYFIDDTNFEPERYIDYVTSGKFLRDEEFNVSYSLKERELKIAGRLFAKMTVDMRAAQTIHEGLLAEGIGKLFSANGVVKSERDLLTHVHRMSAQSGGSPASSSPDEYITHASFLTTDITKYCLSFRGVVMQRFCDSCDQIYGLSGFFNWQHDILENKRIYVADPFCPPSGLTAARTRTPPAHSDIVIQHPLGGIEGYQQKGWTLFSIAVLQLAAARSGTRITAVVQGDNQVTGITIRVPADTPLAIRRVQSLTKAREFAWHLAKILESQGQILKERETIISHSFFVYSKRIMYQGSMLPQSCKAATRINLFADTLLDDLRSGLSSVATSCTKIQNQGGAPDLCYKLNLIHSIRQLVHSIRHRIDNKLQPDIARWAWTSPSIMVAWVLTPSQIGGLGYYSLTRCYVRNIGDPLVVSLADCKRLVLSSVLPASWVQRFLSQPRCTLRWCQWAADPYGLNIASTMTLSKIIEDITQKTVLSTAKNPMLRDLFHGNAAAEDEAVSQYFMDRPVIMPRIAHAAIEETPVGERKKIAALIDTTKTVIMQALKRESLDIKTASKIMGYETDQFVCLIRLLRNDEGNQVWLINASTCSVQLAQELRAFSWFHLALGRSIKGLEVPDILECCFVIKISGSSVCASCSSDDPCHIWAKIPGGVNLEETSDDQPAQRTPYFGSTTSEKSTAVLHSVKDLSRAARRALRISKICVWIFGRSDASWAVAHFFANTRANIPLDVLKLLTPVSVSVNINHRLHESSTQMTYNLAREGRATRYMLLSTDAFKGVISSADEDTNFVYQSGMLYLCASIEDEFRTTVTTGPVDTVFHMHVDNKCCIQAMEADDLYDPLSTPMPGIKHSSTNRLIYDPSPIKIADLEYLRKPGPARGALDFSTWRSGLLSNVGAVVSGSLLAQTILFTEKSMERFMMADGTKDSVVGFITEFLTWDPLVILTSSVTTLLFHLANELCDRGPTEQWRMTSRLARILSNMSHANLYQLRIILSHEAIRDRCNKSIQLTYATDETVLTSCTAGEIVRLIVWIASQTLARLNNPDQDPIQTYICVNDAETAVELSRRRLLAAERLMGLPARADEETESEPSSSRLDTIISRADEHNITISCFAAPEGYINSGCIAEWKRRQHPPVFLGQASKMNSDTQIDGLRSQLLQLLPQIPLSQAVLSRCENALLQDWSLQYQGIPHSRFQRDDRSYLLRLCGVDSTSHYKLWQVLESLATSGHKVSTALCLAEGSGSIMAAVKTIWPDAKVFFNTLLREGDLMEQRVGTIRPTEYLRVAGIQEWQNNRDPYILCNGTRNSTDLGCSECPSFIRLFLSGEKMDIITCDLEYPRETTHHEVIRTLGNILRVVQATLAMTGIFICKLTIMNDWSWFWALQWIRRIFKRVRLVATPFRHLATAEFYAISSDMAGSSILKIQLNKIPLHDPAAATEIYLSSKIQDIMEDSRQSTLKALSNSWNIDQLHRVLQKLGFKPACSLLCRFGYNSEWNTVSSRLRTIAGDEIMQFWRAFIKSEKKSSRLQTYNVTEQGAMKTQAYRIKVILNVEKALSFHTEGAKFGVWPESVTAPVTSSPVPKSEKRRTQDALQPVLASTKLKRADIKDLWKIAGLRQVDLL